MGQSKDNVWEWI